MELTMNVIGHLGQDAVVKDYSGKKVVNFSVAHTEKFKDKKGTVTEKTIWVECAYWERENLAPYLKKGTLVSATGDPSANGFASKETGEIKGSLRLNVHRLKLLSAGNGKEAEVKKTAGKKRETVEADDDLPDFLK